MIGKGMFMSKNGKSLDQNEYRELLEKKGFTRTFVVVDEQTDDYSGFPQIT